MGSEDLFHKRKARKKDELLRKKSSRKPYDRILIVCEGQKTEPFYFEEIRVILELDSANIEIDGSCGSSPISVVTHASKLYQRESSSGDSYNKVFCVFDRDSHSTFHQAVSRIEEINQGLHEEGIAEQVQFKAITSIPSFEYWFLLHYNPTTKPYSATQSKSTGAQVISELQKFLPDYKKSQRGLYQKSLDENTLQGALAHSERIYESAKITSNTNPSTNVHELILYLQSIKKD